MSMLFGALIAAVSLALPSYSARLDPPDRVFATLPDSQLIASAESDPIAVRGSVLMIPIVRRSTEDAWPATVQLQLGDGRGVVGLIARLESRRVARSQWTSPMLLTTATEPSGDQDIVLLAPLPEEGEGEIILGEQHLTPAWMDGLAMRSTSPASEAMRSDADLADPAAPSEYFRAVLQAHQLNLQPPLPMGREREVLYARAVAGLWSAGIARLQENDAAAAKGVLGDLVGRAHGVVNDQARSMAVWESSESDLDELLRSLLEPKSAGIVIAAAAKVWLDHRSPLMFWVEEDQGEAIVIGVANPRGEAFPLEFRWPDQREAALHGEIAPESFHTFIVPRSRPDDAPAVIIDEALSAALHEYGLTSLLPPANLSGTGQGRDALEAQARAQSTLIAAHGNNRVVIPVGLGRNAVRPPGLGFGLFLPAAALSQVRAGSVESPPLEWATTAGIRRRPTGWELIFESFTPAGAHPTTDLITVMVSAGADHTIKIHSDGRVECDDPSVRDGAAVHRSIDRWRARLPLPESWVTPENGRPGKLEVSIERLIEGSEFDTPPRFARRQFAGLAPLEIGPMAKRIPLDLSSWSLSSVTLAP